MFKLPQDTGTRPEIVAIEGLLTLRNLNYPPRDDEPIPLEADVHVILLDPREVENRCHRQAIGGLSVLYARLGEKGIDEDHGPEIRGG